MADIDWNTLPGDDRGVIVRALTLAIAVLETLPEVGRFNDVENMRRVLGHPGLNVNADAATKEQFLLLRAMSRAIEQRKV